jgi:hypothetical protein
MWEMLAGTKSREPSAGSLVENGNQLSETSARAADSNVTVQYPKISVGSSFASQISDHGHQPDTVFDDRSALGADASKATTEESLNQQDDVMTDGEPDLASRKPVDHSKGVQQSDGPSSDIESDPPRQLIKKSPGAARKRSEVTEHRPSSDDEFPPLEQVLSQHEPKVEKTTTVSSHVRIKEDTEYDKIMASLEEDPGEESDQLTPKASRNRTMISQRPASQPNLESRKSLARDSGLRSSQTRVSQSQPQNFIIPQGTEVMDLTLSSDVDDGDNHVPNNQQDDEEDDGPKSAVAVMRRFRTYKVADDDDEDFKDSDEDDRNGWVKKKASSQSVTRRHTGTGLGTSSQTSLNSRSVRRRTAPRF